MILTPRFVFLHLHKSGGTFVNECLLRFLPEATQVGYHLPRAMIPPEYAALPILGLVRNPWSYYVSWFAFQSGRSQPNALFRILSDDGRLDFRGTVFNMLQLGSSPDHLDQLVEALPASYGNRGLNLPGFALAQIRGTGLGFYSYLYQYMFGEQSAATVIGCMESLRQDLPRMLESVGQAVSDPMREFIQAAARRNTADHGHYAAMYDDELREMVAKCDAPLIARHGFRFGD
jgi:hypothetical protein